MSARIWAPPRLFYVNTPSAVAEDLGCAYTLEVDDLGEKDSGGSRDVLDFMTARGYRPLLPWASTTVSRR